MRKILLNTLIMLAFTLSFFSKEALGEGFAYPGGDDKKANAQTSVYPRMPRPIFPLHPIEISVTTDKKIYYEGDTINFLVSVKNLHAKPFILKYKFDTIRRISYELWHFIVWPELSSPLELIKTGNVDCWESFIRGYSNMVIGKGAILPYYNYNRIPDVYPPPSPKSFEPGEYILKVKLTRSNRKNDSYEASTYLVIEPKNSILLDGGQ